MGYRVFVNNPPKQQNEGDFVFTIPTLPSFRDPPWTLGNKQLDEQWREIAAYKLFLRRETGQTVASARVLLRALDSRLDDLLGEMDYRDNFPEFVRNKFRFQGRENGEPRQPSWLPVPSIVKNFYQNR